MTMKTEPFLSGKYGWDLGENNWKDGADENFKKFSYMLNGNVTGFVSSLPVSPMDGDAYFLSTDNTLNARVEGAWNKFPVPKGFIVTDKATGLKYEFNGSAFVVTLNSADKTKLNGIATGATVNSTDAALRDRSTHTGAQAISTITSLQSSLDAKAPLDSPTLTGTVTAPTVTPTDNTTKVATTAFVKAQGYLTSASAGLVTSVAARTGEVVLVKADVGLSNVDNTSDLNKPTSTATQGSLNAKADLVSPTFTGTVTLPSGTSIGSVTSTQIGYLAGVTSNIQGQINSLSGASGAYAPINNPTFTGTVNGITKAMVGLGNVDNTSDVSKPISTATQTALNLKQNSLSGTGFVKSVAGTISYDNNTYVSSVSPTFTGTVTLPSTTSIGSVTNTQIGYLVNTTADIQSQLNSKQTVIGYTPVNKAGDTVGQMVISTSTNLPLIINTTASYGAIQTQIGGTSGGIFKWDSNSIVISSPDLSKVIYITNANSGVSGDFIVSGSISGIGSTITSLNASNISTGTLSTARLPFTVSSSPSASTVVQRDASGDIYGNNFIASATVFASLFSGDGSNLTGLNASNINSGTLSSARLPFSYTNTNTNNSVVQRDGSGSFSANTITGTHVGDGSGLNSLNASAISIGTVPNANLNSATTSTTGIVRLVDSYASTSLTLAPTANALNAVYALSTNASNLSTGTLSDSRLSSNVALVSNVVTKATPSQLFQSLGSVSGTVNVNAANGTHVLMTIAGATSIVLTSPSSTEVVAYTIEYTNAGTNVTHPSGVRWAGGVAPTLTTSGTDVVVYTKAGTNAWRGYLSSKDNR